MSDRFHLVNIAELQPALLVCTHIALNITRCTTVGKPIDSGFKSLQKWFFSSF